MTEVEMTALRSPPGLVTMPSGERRSLFSLVSRRFRVLAVMGLVAVISWHWKVGLGLLLVGLATYVAVERSSAPPFNNLHNFTIWLENRERRRPVLVCLGDSLLHGTCSSPITAPLSSKLCRSLGLDPPDFSSNFFDPLWIVNGGQNGITSHRILEERLAPALEIYPDYLLLWIGTTEVLGMHHKKTALGRELARINGLSDVPTIANLAHNIEEMLSIVEEALPSCRVGICTLTPLGEDLDSTANQLVQQANDIIERAVASFQNQRNFLIVPVYARFKEVLEKKKKGRTGLNVDGHPVWLAAAIACSLFCPSKWVSKMLGHAFLSDGVHLNDLGRDEVVDVMVDWLIKNNVAKAIAVKSR